MKFLVVVDVQNDFVDGVLGSKEAVSIIDYLKVKINNFDGEVVYTMDTHDKNYLQTQEGKLLPVLHCLKGSDGWKIVDGIYKENSKIFEKNAFGSLDMIKYFEKINCEKEIDSIEFVGICTDICVVTNVLLTKAHLPQISLLVDSKGCSGVNVKSHNQALNTMEMCQVKII